MKDLATLRLLLVTRQFPYPERDGESVAIQHMSRALSRAGVEVHLFAINTSKQAYDGPTDIEQLSHYRSITTVLIDNRINPTAAITSLMRPTPYYVSRYDSDAVRDSLLSLMRKESFDVIQLEGLQTMIYASQIKQVCPAAKLIYRPHNVESQIWRRSIAKNPWKARSIYQRLGVAQLEKYESSIAHQADTIIALSPVDRDWFAQYHDDVHFIPIGMENVSMPRSSRQVPTIGFLGSMDWHPNVEGLGWYLDEIHEQIAALSNDYRLMIAGRNLDKSMITRDEHMSILGEVADVNDFWSQVDVLIVPLHIGSGTRVKIIEAMMHKVLVVSTSVGIEGIPADDRHAIIIDDVHDWQESIESIVSGGMPTHEERIAAAHDLAMSQYSSDGCARQFIEIYHQRS